MGINFSECVKVNGSYITRAIQGFQTATKSICSRLTYRRLQQHWGTQPWIAKETTDTWGLLEKRMGVIGLRATWNNCYSGIKSYVVRKSVWVSCCAGWVTMRWRGRIAELLFIRQEVKLQVCSIGSDSVSDRGVLVFCRSGLRMLGWHGFDLLKWTICTQLGALRLWILYVHSESLLSISCGPFHGQWSFLNCSGVTYVWNSHTKSPGVKGLPWICWS